MGVGAERIDRVRFWLPWLDSTDDGVASMVLFGAKGAAAVAGFGANAVLARTLGAAEFGRYAFGIATLTFLSQFFDFGFFTSGARLLTVARHEDERRGYAGAMLAVGAGLSLLFVGVTWLASRLVDHIFTDQIGHLLATVAVLSPALITPFFVEQALKSVRRTSLLAVWTLVTKVLFLATVGALWLSGQATATYATTAYLGTLLAGFLVVLPAIRPGLAELPRFIRRISVEQQRFGRQVYVGKVANLASYNSDRLLLAYFSSATTVGFYSLAMSMGSAVTMFAQSTASSAFSSFSRRRPISERVRRLNAIGVLVLGAGTVVAGVGVVHFYLGPAYAAVAGLVLPATVAAMFQGAYQPYNSWLLANGLGAALRRFLFITAAVNLGMNLLLIPTLGALGGTLASGIGMATYLVLAVRAYRRALRDGP